MKIIKNEKLIKRNAQIGSWTSLAALVVLGGGMYLSFTRPELFIYSLIALLLGFTLTQVGMYMGNKFGRSPRPDEKLDAGLKGLQNEFVMYHYTTPVSHLLVGPAGVWVVMPYHQRGQVEFQKESLAHEGRRFSARLYAHLRAGRLWDVRTSRSKRDQSLKKYLLKHMDESEIPEINALMVFTNDDVEINAEGSPVPALKLKQLKDFVRQKAKEKKLPAETLNKLKTVLE